MAYAVPTQLRGSLSSLVDALLPLEAWLQTKTYQPAPQSLIPSEPSLPWRASGQTLSADTLDVLKGFEAWVADDADNEELSPRWLMLKAHPTAFFQYETDSVASWRTARKLNSTAVFAPFFGRGANLGTKLTPLQGGHMSLNMSYVLTRPNEPDGPGDPVPRARYYDVCFSLLEQALAAHGPVQNWFDFATLLMGNAPEAAWPAASPVSSELFIKRFTSDLLIACMGQKNPALSARAPIWQRAVLIEAGENRHRGNEYGPAETGHAVAELMSKLDGLPSQK